LLNRAMLPYMKYFQYPLPPSPNYLGDLYTNV